MLPSLKGDKFIRILVINVTKNLQVSPIVQQLAILLHSQHRAYILILQIMRAMKGKYATFSIRRCRWLKIIHIFPNVFRIRNVTFNKTSILVEKSSE